MAVTVDIPGVGEVEAKNAASEATLREILKNLGGRSPQGSPPGQGGGPGKEAGKTAEELQRLGKSTRVATNEVDSFSKKLSNFAGGILNLLTSAVGATVGSVVGLGKQVLVGGQQLSDFAQHIPIPGLQAFSGLLDNQINLFRDLSQSGASFGNNMFEIVRVAGDAAIPLADFAGLIQSNAEGLRLFGPSVNSGARSFATLAKQLRQGDSGKRLMQMGFTTGELNENMINFNEMMFTAGRTTRMTNRELVEGTAKYSLELDKIAKLSGKSRKQLEEEMKAKNLDIRRQMAINRLGPEFAVALQDAATASPKLEAALLDMADGVANDPLTRMLMANSDTFRNEAQNIQNMTAEERRNFFMRVKEDGMKFANQLGEAGVQASMAGGTATGEFVGMVGELGKVRGVIPGTIDAEQAARDKATGQVSQFAEAAATATGIIQQKILDTKLFQKLSEDITNFLPSIEDAENLANAATPHIESAMSALEGVYDYLKEDGIKLLKESVTGIWNWMTGDGLKMAKTAYESFMKEGGMYDQIKAFIDEMVEIIPKMVEFGKQFLQDPTGVFNDVILPEVLKWGGMVAAGIGAAIIGVIKGPALIGALGAMLMGIITGPFGIAFLVGTAVVAAITTAIGFFGIDGIKDYAQKGWDAFTQGIKDMWKGIMDFFTGIMNFDLGEFFSNLVPDSVKNSPLNPMNWFGSSKETAKVPSSMEVAEAESQVEKVTPTINKSVGADAESAVKEGTIALNTLMQEQNDLMRKQNKLLAKLDGNMLG